METEVANPLRMLSAYFITAATTSPPRAYSCRQHTKKVTHLYDYTYKWHTLYRISAVSINAHIDLHVAA